MAPITGTIVGISSAYGNTVCVLSCLSTTLILFPFAWASGGCPTPQYYYTCTYTQSTTSPLVDAPSPSQRELGVLQPCHPRSHSTRQSFASVALASPPPSLFQKLTRGKDSWIAPHRCFPRRCDVPIISIAATPPFLIFNY